MRAVAFAAGLTLALAVPAARGAQENGPLVRPAEVAAFAHAASRHIWLVAPTLTSQEVADALRRAAVERGVAVCLLAQHDQATFPASYVQGLSRLRGVQVRLAKRVEEAALVIDDRYLIRGPLVYRVTVPGEPAETWHTDLRQMPMPPPLARWLAALPTLWERAVPYIYQPIFPGP